MQSRKSGWAACGGVLIAPVLACVAATNLAEWSHGSAAPDPVAVVSGAQGGATQGGSARTSRAPVASPELAVWTHVRANYAVRAQLTDLRPLRLGADFMVALDLLPKSEWKAQPEFVEAVPITSAELAVGGKSLNLPFYVVAGRLVAFVPTGRVPSGATVSVVARGTTTIGFLGRNAGPGAPILEAAFPMP